MTPGFYKIRISGMPARKSLIMSGWFKTLRFEPASVSHILQNALYLAVFILYFILPKLSNSVAG